MANYNTLKGAIEQVIKTNGNNEITGALLQQSLVAMINSLGAGYQFAGVAVPATNPGTPDYNVFYFAGPGTYPNFDNANIPARNIGLLSYNGTWHVSSVQTTPFSAESIVNDIIQLYDGTTPVYPRTRAEAVFFDNDTTKALPQQFSQLEQKVDDLDIEMNGGTFPVDFEVAGGGYFGGLDLHINSNSDYSTSNPIRLLKGDIISAKMQLLNGGNGIVEVPSDVFDNGFANGHGTAVLVSNGTGATAYQVWTYTATKDMYVCVTGRYPNTNPVEISVTRNKSIVNDLSQLNTEMEETTARVDVVEDKVAVLTDSVYDKAKSYFFLNITNPSLSAQSDFRFIWDATNIKNEESGTCTVDWGDGSPVLAITDRAELQHTYPAVGKYVLVLTGLKTLESNLFWSNKPILTDAKIANTFVNFKGYNVFASTPLEQVEFFGETPASTGFTGTAIASVAKFIVPTNAIVRYVHDWYAYSFNQNKDFLTKKLYPKDAVGYIYNPTTVTVGVGGDYPTITEAMMSLSRLYPIYNKGGVPVVIKILSGTTIAEQIFVDGVDFSWMQIEYEDYDPASLNYDNVAADIASGTIVFDTTEGYNAVPVDASGFSQTTHDTRGDVCLFRAENGGRLPIVNCVFKLVTGHSSGVCGMLCNRGSEGIVKTLAGFIGFKDGVIANNESSITIREGITMNCARWGCHARHNGEVSARSVIATGCGSIGTTEAGAAVADRVANMDVREAYLGNSRVAIRASNASMICARAAHIIGGGVSGVYLVQAEYSGIINASQIEFSGVTGGGLSVNHGGQMDAFSLIGSPSFNVTKNEVSANGIIYG